MLVRIWKAAVLETAFMALANTAGKISGTGSNNVKGRLGVVRPDRVRIRWKRRLQVETIYNGISDTYSVAAHMRWGMGFFDTEATAVTYNVPVTLN